MNESSLRSDEHQDGHIASSKSVEPALNPLLADENGETLPLPEVCARIHGKVEEFLKKEEGNGRLKGLQAQTRISLGVLDEALARYSSGVRRVENATYTVVLPCYQAIELTTKHPSLDSLSLSYNGGKDCLVLLILYLAALHTHFQNQPQTPETTQPKSTKAESPLPSELNSVYIVPPDPFPEVDAFVASSASTYHLQIQRYPTPMRDAFSSYLVSNPSIRAIFVGTRRTDPHGGELKHFDPTDRGWPAFMRIHPVIDWHYAEVWDFLRALGVRWCGLYDKGYTSLGGVGDTWRNPRLREDSGGGEERYRPAWMLEEDGEERLGRDR